ncbi:acylamino-acid-releasing enzyme-like [Coccinella septempunctata]|uniref:acylamino-acid-releasing enzyme-like n=1 Tax=Coccinella septempunctata TaxID=41139 RepID=UPI001D06BBD5|nr:acylamino-acid-releasing enzyme-like [Coccinella septempunctata]
MDKIVNIYRSLCLIPALIEAKLDRSGKVVYSLWSHRNLEKSKTTKFLKHILLYPDLQKDQEFSPIDVSNELLSCVSPSERFKAVLRESDEKQYLEIWEHQNLYRTVDLNLLDLHGKVYCDGEFNSFHWSPNEKKLLYVAEKKAADAKPFYKRKVKEEESKKSTANPGEEYIFQQDWGEQMVGKKKSVIAEYDVENDTVSILEGIPDNVCPGQVKFSPCGQYVIGVGYETLPRKLGLIYCTNRPTKLFKLKDGKYEIISSDNEALRNPIFTPDGKSIIYFAREAKGPHMAGVELIQRNLECTNSADSNARKIIVPIVEEEMDIENDEKFFGLYYIILSKRCWGSENRLILSTNQENTIESFVIDLDSGKITRLKNEYGSLIVLDVYNDTILANSRNFLHTDVLVIGKLPPKGQEHSIDWIELTCRKKLDTLKNHKYEYLKLCQNVEDKVKNFSAIYVGPSSGDEKSIPLIVYPHGGPHSAFTNNFSLDISFSLSNGFAVLLINYRGSIGAGNNSVQSLLGRIGVSDVSDCVLATNEALKKYPWLDPSKMVLCGGSHGGFLVTHLSGQYPDMFKAVVARNPVIDVASMSIFSDIPDWCYVECGKEYTQVGPIDDEILLKMRNCSPLVHAHKVKAPTMLQVGSNDLRVPPGQSLEYYHRLKANGVKVIMHLYDDNHPLGQVKNEMDNLINTILWLNQHIENKN